MTLGPRQEGRHPATDDIPLRRLVGGLRPTARDGLPLGAPYARVIALRLGLVYVCPVGPAPAGWRWGSMGLWDWRVATVPWTRR